MHCRTCNSSRSDQHCLTNLHFKKQWPPSSSRRLQTEHLPSSFIPRRWRFSFNARLFRASRQRKCFSFGGKSISRVAQLAPLIKMPGQSTFVTRIYWCCQDMLDCLVTEDVSDKLLVPPAQRNCMSTCLLLSCVAATMHVPNFSCNQTQNTWLAIYRPHSSH